MIGSGVTDMIADGDWKTETTGQSLKTVHPHPTW